MQCCYLLVIIYHPLCKAAHSAQFGEMCCNRMQIAEYDGGRKRTITPKSTLWWPPWSQLGILFMQTSNDSQHAWASNNYITFPTTQFLSSDRLPLKLQTPKLEVKFQFLGRHRIFTIHLQWSAKIVCFRANRMYWINYSHTYSYAV